MEGDLCYRHFTQVTHNDARQTDAQLKVSVMIVWLIMTLALLLWFVVLLSIQVRGLQTTAPTLKI